MSRNDISNAKIADILLELSKIYTKNLYGKKAIFEASKKIRDFPEKITKISQLKEESGIGEGILRRVNEILKTGKLEELVDAEEKHSEERKQIEDLSTILFIGEAKARKLIEMGITSVDQLRRNVKKADLTENQTYALKYHDDINTKLTYDQVEHVGHCIINNVILTYDTGNNIALIVGSHRRRKANSSDVDILLNH